MVNLNNSAHDIATQTPDRTAGSALYTIMGLALIVALAALGAAHGLKGWFETAGARAPEPALAVMHRVSVGSQRYAIPAGLISDPVQRRDGFAERIDMTLALPLLPGGRLSEIEIAIMPRGRARTSAALLDSVYLHQFSRQQLSGPPGLVGKPLDLDAGTRGETVWYDPLSANPFVAKCMTPVHVGSDGRTCLRVFSLADRNTVTVTFDAAILAHWRDFDAGIETALDALRQ